tara:strand:+ start:3087 stop:3281 length:195 start_codon:yes stop_codon:yes gene_type:complete
MTKFNDDFIKEVKEYWESNKGKFKHEEQTGTHMKRKTEKKFGLPDMAEKYSLTISQIRRILYVK